MQCNAQKSTYTINKTKRQIYSKIEYIESRTILNEAQY